MDNHNDRKYRDTVAYCTCRSVSMRQNSWNLREAVLYSASFSRWPRPRTWYCTCSSLSRTQIHRPLWSKVFNTYILNSMTLISVLMHSGNSNIICWTNEFTELNKGKFDLDTRISFKIENILIKKLANNRFITELNLYTKVICFSELWFQPTNVYVKYILLIYTFTSNIFILVMVIQFAKHDIEAGACDRFTKLSQSYDQLIMWYHFVTVVTCVDHFMEVCQTRYRSRGLWPFHKAIAKLRPTDNVISFCNGSYICWSLYGEE